MSALARSRSRLLAAIESNLRGGSTFLFGAFMVANGLAYLYQMVLSRTLSPADYGAMVTLTSIFYVLAVFWRAAQAWVIDAVAGTGGAATRPNEVVATTMRLMFPLAGIVLALHWLGRGAVMDFLRLATPTPVIVLGVYVASSFLLPVAVGLPLGLDRLRLASGVIVVEPIVRLLVGLGLIAIGLGVNGALGGYIAGNIVPFAVTICALWAVIVGKPGHGATAEGRPRALSRYALFALATNAGLMAIASVDLVAVKHYFAEDIAGNYAVAFLLGRITSTSTASLAWVIFARSATMASDDPRRRRLLVNGLLATGLIACVLTAVYLFAPSLVVRLMSGSQYGMADRYVGLVGIEMALFSLAYVQAYYLISIRKLQVVWPLGLATVIETFLLVEYHATIEQVLLVLILVMAGLLAWVSVLTWSTLRVSGKPFAPPVVPTARVLADAG